MSEPDTFELHCQACAGCRMWPISMACYIGAKLLNPSLPDKTEEEYNHRMQAAHEDCEWCKD